MKDLLAQGAIGVPAVADVGIKANLAGHREDVDGNATIAIRLGKAMTTLEGTRTSVRDGVNTGTIVCGVKGIMVTNHRVRSGARTGI
jgi:hypothetical protein